jgi:predicted patatin/cPLA2 family phospholipase
MINETKKENVFENLEEKVIAILKKERENEEKRKSNIHLKENARSQDRNDLIELSEKLFNPFISVFRELVKNNNESFSNLIKALQIIHKSRTEKALERILEKLEKDEKLSEKEEKEVKKLIETNKPINKPKPRK